MLCKSRRDYTGLQWAPKFSNWYPYKVRERSVVRNAGTVGKEPGDKRQMRMTR